MTRKRQPKTPDQAITEGQRAKRELEVTSQAFEDVKQALLEAIGATTLLDTAGREKLYCCIQVLPHVRSMLEKAVNDGVAAQYDANIAAITGEPIN